MLVIIWINYLNTCEVVLTNRYYPSLSVRFKDDLKESPGIDAKVFSKLFRNSFGIVHNHHPDILVEELEGKDFLQLKEMQLLKKKSCIQKSWAVVYVFIKI